MSESSRQGKCYLSIDNESADKNLSVGGYLGGLDLNLLHRDSIVSLEDISVGTQLGEIKQTIRNGGISPNFGGLL